MIKLVNNFLDGFLSVMSASQISEIPRRPHKTMADALLADWQGVAKDIKRVQGKLKAEAHDGRKHHES